MAATKIKQLLFAGSFMGLGRLEICFRWFREVGDLFRRAFGVGRLGRLEICLGGFWV